MDYSTVMDAAGYVIYAGLALIALWGVFCVVMLFRRISARRFWSRESESRFLGKVRDELRAGHVDEALKVCRAPAYWQRAVPQLASVALQNHKESPSKLRRMLAERFQRDVLADLEHRLSWVNTVVKSAPMMGLLGTVVGMIGAFGKIAGAQTADPSSLAGDISLALFTTAIGLMIAVPLVLCSSMINVRVRKLEDAVEEGVAQFLDEFESFRLTTPPKRSAEYAGERS